MNMTILILSDTHGNTEGLKHVLSLHRDSDAIIHLGDGCQDFKGIDLGGIPLYRVRGNCDEFYNNFGTLKDEEVIELGGMRILMTHGHRLDVKSGLKKAASYAVSKDVDILLYGHTHVPQEIELKAGDRVGITLLEKPMWIFNPGSLEKLRGCKMPSFGVLTIRDGQVLLSHGKISH